MVLGKKVAILDHLYFFFLLFTNDPYQNDT